MKTVILIVVALVVPVVAIAFWVLVRSAHYGEDNNPSESDSETQGDTQGTGTTVPSSDDSSDSTDGASPHVSQEPHEEYEPKFVIGDRITNGTDTYTIQDVKPNGYLLEGQPPLYLPFTEEEKWELAGDTQGTGTTVPSSDDSSDSTDGASPHVSQDGFDGERMGEIFHELVEYFSKIVPIDPKATPTTNTYLYVCFTELYVQATVSEDRDNFMRLYIRDNFPEIIDTTGDEVNPLVIHQAGAMLFYCILSELMPAKAQALAEGAYNYGVKGAEQPIYGWTFYSDPNIARLMAFFIYARCRRPDYIEEMRGEVGGKMVNDISDLKLDFTTFMPTAAGPYLAAYQNRKKGVPVGDKSQDGNLLEDRMVDDYVAENYTLDAHDAIIRQRTIQSIANKEYRAVHLFGKDRTVSDPQYGTMTFSPVFGLKTIGMEISDCGAFAALADAVGSPASNNRKSLLDQEYGRRRPGEGEIDGSANSEPNRRALVNEPIENGDGHSTGSYDKNGDYVFDDGTHVGNYVTYYQNQLYANSYPSGHSAYIMPIAMALVEVMPDLAAEIMQAMGWFRLSRVICRYHHQSDTTIGLICGGMFLPLLHACKAVALDDKIDDARKELSGDPAPSPEPTEKVNTSLSWVLGGYGSCHVDAGEQQMGHCCTKEANKDRYPSIEVSQTVKFKIEGAGVSTIDGKTEGIFEAGAQYVLMCPAVTDDRTATITLRNDNGVRKIYYTLSLRGTHDDGPAER